MLNPIFPKRNTLILIAALLLSTAASKAAAAPLCAQVLRPPPTQEQISAMMSELARMALESDLEKVSGIHGSLLQDLFDKKITEAARRLYVSKEEISAQLNTRIPLLQKIESKKFQEDQQLRSEQQAKRIPAKPLRFHFDKNKSVNIYKKRYVGVSEIADGRRAVIYMSRGPTERIFKLFSNTGSGGEKLVAKDVFTAVVDPLRNRVVAIQTEDMESASVHFYSLTDLKELSPAVKLPWNINTELNLLIDSSLKIFPDGEHFILSTNSHSAEGSFKDPTAIKVANNGLPGVFILGAQEYVTVSGQTLVRDRDGKKELLDLRGEDGEFFHTISHYGEDQISIIGTQSVVLVNLNTWSIHDRYEQRMGSIVMKNDIDGYIVGTKDFDLVMKQLEDDDSQATKLVDRSTIRSGSRFNQVHPYPDGKGFAAVARDNNTGNDWLYFFEREGVELIP